MKKKMVVVLLTGVLLSVSACSNSGTADTSQSDGQNTEQTAADKEKNEQTDDNNKTEVTDEADKENNQTEQDDKSVEINIYSGNDDATAFVSESIKIDELTPENVASALVQKSVLSSDVQVLNLEKQTVDGKESLDVDFNEAFGTLVSSKGTAGEYYTIGSVVNTFLDAYDCEQIQITVAGEVLETGHNDYPGYLNRFE